MCVLAIRPALEYENPPRVHIRNAIAGDIVSSLIVLNRVVDWYYTTYNLVRQIERVFSSNDYLRAPLSQRGFLIDSPVSNHRIHQSFHLSSGYVLLRTAKSPRLFTGHRPELQL